MAWSKVAVSSLVATVIGGSVLLWTGGDSLDHVEQMYSSLKQNYQNALTNIGTYKDVLDKKKAQLKDMNKIKEQLLAECNEKDEQIQTLTNELNNLKESGTQEDQQRISELESQLSELQTEYNEVVTKLNNLSTKYNDLYGQLTQANSDAQELEQRVEEMADITETKVLTEEEIDGGEDYKLYLTFTKASNSTTDKDISSVITYLNSKKWFDAKRESPIQIHATGTGRDTTTLYINNVNAFNKMTANAVEGFDENTNGVYYPGSGDVYYLVVDSTKYELIKASDNTWTTTFGYESTDNGTK